MSSTDRTMEPSGLNLFILATFLVAVLASSLGAADKILPTYRCKGFDEPMNHDEIHIERSRVLPLRAKLVLPDGSFGDDQAIDTPPLVTLFFIPETGPDVDVSAGIQVWDYGKGTSFVFDPEAHWKFDLGTDKLQPAGRYRVRLATGDASEYRVEPTCSLIFVLDP